MWETLLIVLDEALVVHGLISVLLTKIEPLPSWGYGNAPHILKPKLLMAFDLLSLLGAQLLALALPSLF